MIDDSHAVLQCAGEVRYACDVAATPRDAHVAMVLATQHRADIVAIDGSDALVRPHPKYTRLLRLYTAVQSVYSAAAVQRFVKHSLKISYIFNKSRETSQLPIAFWSFDKRVLTYKWSDDLF